MCHPRIPNHRLSPHGLTSHQTFGKLTEADPAALDLLDGSGERKDVGHGACVFPRATVPKPSHWVAWQNEKH